MPVALEDFKGVNRMRLFNLLKENKSESVVFISGDVHSAQTFANECTSYTGQKILPEFTSSGLSHTLHEMLPTLDLVFNILTPPESVTSQLFIANNYGSFDVPIEESDIAFYGSIRDQSGTNVISRYYTKEDLAFYEANLRFDIMCKAKG